MILEYNTIMEDCNGGMVEKKSKFLTNLFHIENENDAKERINRIRKQYYDAKHHVFAYITLDGNNIVERYSDDGEPSGTAGKPILDILKQKNICNVLVVVTRYFGGILLGTGGLSRAYSDSALVCINGSKLDIVEYCRVIKIKANYDEIDKIKYLVKDEIYRIEKIEYLDNIFIYLIIVYNNIENIKSILEKMLNRNVDTSIFENKFVKK